MREHRHDWKFKGINPKLSQLGGARITGKLYVCSCGATQIKGVERPVAVKEA